MAGSVTISLMSLIVAATPPPSQPAPTAPAAPPATVSPAAPPAPAETLPTPSKDAVAAQTLIDTALHKINKEIKRDGNVWSFDLAKRQVIVVTDPIAERMRILVPVIEADKLDSVMLKRLMQANFDSALDARYAVAQDLLWGVYIHPLVGMSEKEFVSGLSQALKVAENFGGSYSSGAIIFGGGDSSGIQAEQLLEQLQQQSEVDKKNSI
jgi:hypothetical protein